MGTAFVAKEIDKALVLSPFKFDESENELVTLNLEDLGDLDIDMPLNSVFSLDREDTNLGLSNDCPDLTMVSRHDMQSHGRHVYKQSSAVSAPDSCTLNPSVESRTLSGACQHAGEFSRSQQNRSADSTKIVQKQLFSPVKSRNIPKTGGDSSSSVSFQGLKQVAGTMVPVDTTGKPLMSSQILSQNCINHPAQFHPILPLATFVPLVLNPGLGTTAPATPSPVVDPGKGNRLTFKQMLEQSHHK